MLESDIEAKFRRAVIKAGGLCYKWVSPGQTGVPDRLVIIDGKVWGVELKTETGRLSPVQHVQLQRLREHGLPCRVLYGLGDVDAFLRELTEGGDG